MLVAVLDSAAALAQAAELKGAVAGKDRIASFAQRGSHSHPSNVVTNHLFSVSLISAPCPEDLDQDGIIGTSDILEALAQFGCLLENSPSGCSGDVNADGNVGVSDILAIL